MAKLARRSLVYRAAALVKGHDTLFSNRITISTATIAAKTEAGGKRERSVKKGIAAMPATKETPDDSVCQLGDTKRAHLRRHRLGSTPFSCRIQTLESRVQEGPELERRPLAGPGSPARVFERLPSMGTSLVNQVPQLQEVHVGGGRSKQGT